MCTQQVIEINNIYYNLKYYIILYLLQLYAADENKKYIYKTHSPTRNPSLQIKKTPEKYPLKVGQIFFDERSGFYYEIIADQRFPNLPEYMALKRFFENLLY